MIGFRSLVSVAAVMVATAACTPDGATSPDTIRPTVGGPTADLGTIATDPILYSQTTNNDNAITSIGAPDGRSMFADDFVVPDGQVWTLASVLLSGVLHSSSLPLSIRADDGGHPGAPLPNADLSLAPTASQLSACCGPVVNYLFTLPKSLTLPAGRYWLAAASVANGDDPFNWQISGGPDFQAMATVDNGASWFEVNRQGVSFSVFGAVQYTQTMTFGPDTPDFATTGTTATLTVTASSSLTVAATAGPPNVCTLTGTTLSFVGAGTCTVTANQAGNATYLPAPQVTHDVHVLLAQTITFPAITPSPAPVGSSTSLGASASSNLAVSYSSLTTTCTVSAGTVNFIATGTCTVAADQAGNTTYGAATRKTQSVQVVTVPQAITFTSTPPSPAYLNGTYTASATGGGSGNPVVITTSTPNVCTLTGNVVRFVAVGTCTIAANQAGNATYDPAAQRTQTVKVDYQFSGFMDPVKGNGTLNTVKAGRAVPLEWRVTDAAGAPITTLTTAVIKVADLSCSAGGSENQVEESTTGGSGLQNLGDGYYQLNWKTPASYARSCKTLQLDLGEGSGVRTASFAFTK